MDWTKIPTNLLIKRVTDNELVAIVKYQLLWAMLEEQPDDKTALRYLTRKQLITATLWLNDIKMQVTSDVQHLQKKRTSRKIYYNKNKGLRDFVDTTQDTTVDTTQTPLDKIRLDNIREDKKENIKERKFEDPIKENFNTLSEDFEMFWKHYPKQRIGNKQKALQAWQRVLKEKRATPGQMIQACRNYAESSEVKRGYAKGCAAWLNDDRFTQWIEGEIIPAKNISNDDDDKRVRDIFQKALKRHKEGINVGF